MNLSEWKQLTESNRKAIAVAWNPYAEDKPYVQPLLRELEDSFRSEYPEIKMTGTGNVFGCLMLVVERPFIFDKRKAPEGYLGLGIRYSMDGPVPPGFEVFSDYVWAPENYLNFVNNHQGRIRKELGDPTMDEEEMLDALVGMSFDEWIRQCQEWGRKFTGMQPGQRSISIASRPWWKIW